MDAFVVLFFIILVICWSCYERSFKKAVYGIASIEIFLRIMYFIRIHLGVSDFASFLGYLPSGILSGVIEKYTNGIICTFLSWLYLILFIVFLFYTVRSFFKNK